MVFGRSSSLRVWSVVHTLVRVTIQPVSFSIPFLILAKQSAAPVCLGQRVVMRVLSIICTTERYWVVSSVPTATVIVIVHHCFLFVKWQKVYKSRTNRGDFDTGALCTFTVLFRRFYRSSPFSAAECPLCSLVRYSARCRPWPCRCMWRSRNIPVR